MNLPLFPYEQISFSIHLIMALVVGLTFGYVLEKGGLGNAKKLIAQFQLKDLAVFKVMFTAIITALLGLFILSSLEMINLDLIAISDSFILPQIVGGLLLGIGFAVAGYCPGTTIVGIATGKIDALFSLVGVVVGTWIFVMAYDLIEDFYFATKIEADTLPQLFSVNISTIIFGIIFIAIAGFYVAERIEQRHE